MKRDYELQRDDDYSSDEDDAHYESQHQLICAVTRQLELSSTEPTAQNIAEFCKLIVGISSFCKDPKSSNFNNVLNNYLRIFNNKRNSPFGVFLPRMQFSYCILVHFKVGYRLVILI